MPAPRTGTTPFRADPRLSGGPRTAPPAPSVTRPSARPQRPSSRRAAPGSAAAGTVTKHVSVAGRAFACARPRAGVCQGLRAPLGSADARLPRCSASGFAINRAEARMRRRHRRSGWRSSLLRSPLSRHTPFRSLRRPTAAHNQPREVLPTKAPSPCPCRMPESWNPLSRNRKRGPPL